MFNIILKILHITFAILLVVAVLLQSPEKGLSSVFGGGGEVLHTKRGAEKILFISTITLGILFAVTSLLNFFIF